MKFSTKSICVPFFAAVLLLPVAGVHAKQDKSSKQKSAKQYAPGQQKKAQGTSKSAKQYAPGQKKKANAGKQSAKQYAPGQQKKNAGNQ